MTTSVVFAAMAEAVEGKSGRALQRKFKGTVVFNISDTGDVYTLDLKGQECSVLKGGDHISSPDLTVTVNSTDMNKLISGSLKPQQAFMKGKLKIKGKMNLAMKLTAVLAATKRKLPTSKM